MICIAHAVFICSSALPNITFDIAQFLKINIYSDSCLWWKLYMLENLSMVENFPIFGSIAGKPVYCEKLVRSLANPPYTVFTVLQNIDAENNR